MLQVRMAVREDAMEVLEIYKPSVLTTAFSFETAVPTLHQFQTRIENCLQKYPWIVCTVNQQVVGYVYASKHREREAYQWSCECSVYIRDSFKGKGIATELYAVLFEILKIQGIRNVYAGITLPNDASVKLHEKCGFKHFANYDNIGYKFNSWKTVGWWKLQLNDYDLNPPPPIKIAALNSMLLMQLFKETVEKLQIKFSY